MVASCAAEAAILCADPIAWINNGRPSTTRSSTRIDLVLRTLPSRALPWQEQRTGGPRRLLTPPPVRWHSAYRSHAAASVAVVASRARDIPLSARSHRGHRRGHRGALRAAPDAV